MARLKIGSYIIDSATSGSTSTTSGVVLDIAETGISYSGSSSSADLAGFIAYVTAASESALKTAVAAVTDTVENCNGLTIVYEETSGTTQHEITNTDWAEVEGRCDVALFDLAAEITISFSARRFASATGGGGGGGGAGDYDGQAGEIEWEWQQLESGLTACVVTIAFQGDATTGAREHALAFVNLMGNTANYPSFLDDDMKMFRPTVKFTQKPNQTDPVPETGYSLAVVTIPFVRLPEPMASSSVFANVKDATLNVSKSARPPLDVRSGQTQPGYDVIISGTIVAKTELDTTFNSSDSVAFASNQLNQLALDAIDALRTEAETRMQEGSFVSIGPPEISIETSTGTIAFAVRYITGSPSSVLTWRETSTVTNTEVDVVSRSTNGSETVYSENGGPICTYAHSLFCEALSPKAYKVSGLGNGWLRTTLTMDGELKENPQTGQATFTTSGSSTWRWVNESATPGSQPSYAVDQLPLTKIPRGTL